ncbi:MAG: hypothetical protein ACRDRT_07925 [Pseudonocardiaceae bacterium]
MVLARSLAVSPQLAGYLLSMVNVDDVAMVSRWISVDSYSIIESLSTDFAVSGQPIRAISDI